MKVTVHCDWCGAEIRKNPSQVHKHNFCDRLCMNLFTDKQMNPDEYADLKDYTHMSEHMTLLNEQMNQDRMTPDIRRKIHDARVESGEGKTYRKYYGRHEHRVVAERMLGRPLKPGEVVHHIDGNKRNNAESNLMVLPSQAEHARMHDQMRKGVRPNEVHTT